MSKPTLTAELLVKINGELAQAAILQRDEAAPPRRPRLSRRPEPRPLLEMDATR
jgi:hypothetical protein